MSLAVAVYWIVVWIVAIQCSFAFAFVAIMYRRKPRLPSTCSPKAAVVLCLRGADPFLRQCIASLLSQQYPDYQLRIIIDRPDDPSREILNEFEADPRLCVSILDNPPDTCSLKCSSIVQAVGELDPSVEVVALCDADSAPQPTWLADLVAPFADESVGVTTGNRWYHPPESSVGSVVRYLWNVPASINMILLHIAWGGSLAIRRRVIDETELLEKWSHALCEDTMLFRVIRQLGYRQVFVPSVLMVNHESCSLSDLMQWIPRQMLTAKLYHPNWPLTVGYGIISFIVPLLAVILALVGWIQTDMESIWIAVTLFIGFELSNVLLVAICQWGAGRQIAVGDKSANQFAWTFWLKLPFWIVLAQLLTPFSFLKCFFARNISWRGIRYQIQSKSIFRETHSPFIEQASDSHSL